jgi:hypothetical protein
MVYSLLMRLNLVFDTQILIFGLPFLDLLTPFL